MSEAAPKTDISFYNRTSDNHIVVMVFARPYPVPITEEILRMAWKIILVPSMGNSKFSYPVKNSIYAFYYDGSNRVSAGPYEAAPGTTWVAQTTESGNVFLEKCGKIFSHSVPSSVCDIMAVQEKNVLYK